MKRKLKTIICDIFMALLAIISIILIVLDYAHEINIISPPYSIIDNSILIIFAIDYFVRLFYAKDKNRFFKENIFDLLSIIPVNNLFYVFRMARIGRAFRLLKLLRIFRLVGLTGRLHKFLKTNGLIYYLYISLTVILIASSLYCISEKVSFGTALWWSITTATTVGYGDVSPTTGLGKAAAVLLMFLGIGFIGMLTSSLTNFFDTSADNDLEKELAELKQQNKKLEDHLSRLEKLVKENK
ncbi:ion transporter [Limosilactobacillus reuteri]|uniref:ion transporter n=1 Tax=Limosilactobacillus reuteri TaxID=1598 RepID=UPI001E566D69|nr:ion transporter [Limosilactobacillus reuteri]MCC4383274.1 ion transporter [Limosilactobacillus reuteri]MCC4420111.1 ion transporter [Limosilactobacillus reuteri]